MKRKVLFLLVALCLTIALLPGTVMAAYEPAVSNNIDGHDYDGNDIKRQEHMVDINWASPVQSYLSENQYGGVTRVEFINQGGYGSHRKGNYVETRRERVVVEEYDRRYQLINQREIPMELPIWGGFFAGEDYNFFIFGQDNSELENKEVMRLVKYSKEWERLDSVGIYGSPSDTAVPFDAGSLDCAEYHGKLYIHTCHEMYNGHLSNMIFEFRERDLEVLDARTAMAFHEEGYVSHSFNQFILVDSEKNIITVDHGDASPRGIILNAYYAKADKNTFTEWIEEKLWVSTRCISVQNFASGGGRHYNYTGAEVGGLAETRNGYLIPYTYAYNEDEAPAYLAFVKKDTLEVTTTTLSTASCGNPYVCPTSLDGGYILWMNKTTGKLNYASYDANGKTGSVREADAQLSDCEPVLHNGELIWYVTTDPAPVYISNGKPVYDHLPTFTFYILGENGVRALFSDVDGGAYYFDAVDWAVKQGITKGTSATTFSPNENCTRAQIVTFLWRAAGSPKPSGTANPYTDVKPGTYYYDAVLWAMENGITMGTSDTTFSPNDSCTRGQIVTFLWRYNGSPAGGTDTPFTDVAADAYYAPAVRWAVKKGITAGTSDTMFSPNDGCTRGQIVTFLYRSRVDGAQIHDHVWTAKTVHHDADGHYEVVVVGQKQGSIIIGQTDITNERWECADCGETFPYDQKAAADDHVWKNPGHNVGLLHDGGEPIYEMVDIEEERWYEDVPAWDETIQVCSVCGAVK